MVISLWFDVAHTWMTACLKLSRFVKVAIEAGRAFHWTTAKGKVFVVVSPSVNLPVCQWVGSARWWSRGWRMKGAALRHIHVLFHRKGRVVSQHAAAQGYASRVFPACLRHLNMVSKYPGPTELPAAGPSRFSVCLCVFKSVWVPDWSSILQLGTNNALVSSFPKFGFFGLEVPSQETKRLVCSICYPGDMGFPWQIATNLIFETEWGRLVFLDRSRTEMMSTLQVKNDMSLNKFRSKAYWSNQEANPGFLGNHIFTLVYEISSSELPLDNLDVALEQSYV